MPILVAAISFCFRSKILVLAAPDGDQLIDKLGDFGVLENRSSLADAIGGGHEAILHRRQQVGRCQVGGLNEDAERKVGFGTQGQHWPEAR